MNVSTHGKPRPRRYRRRTAESETIPAMDVKTNPSGLSGAALKALLSPPRPKLTVRLRNKFIAGLVILVPIVITVNVLWWLFTFVDGFAQPIFVALVGRPIPGIG